MRFIMNLGLKGKRHLSDWIQKENGETNIVAIIMIIVIVIGIAIIFRDRITNIVNNLFDQIESKSNKI